MERLHETLIDLALEIGYLMGEKGEGYDGDSREAVRRIYDAAVGFEERFGQIEQDYLTAVQEEGEIVYTTLPNARHES